MAVRTTTRSETVSGTMKTRSVRLRFARLQTAGASPGGCKAVPTKTPKPPGGAHAFLGSLGAVSQSKISAVRPPPGQRDQRALMRVSVPIKVKSASRFRSYLGRCRNPRLFLSFFLFALVFDSLFPPFSLMFFILLSLSFFLFPCLPCRRLLPRPEPSGAPFRSTTSSPVAGMGQR